jgi:hypothetical protein
LAISLFTLVTFSSPNLAQKTPESGQPEVASALEAPRYGIQVYASLAAENGAVTGAATSADGRVEIIRQYLEEYQSPLLPFAQNLVDAADDYGLDFRLLVAIAQQESNLCKKEPADSYNCWGWGVHSRGVLRFENYEAAIEEVAQGIREEYIDKGYTTPEEIMAKYTPLSPGTWAAGIRQFLEEME